MEMRVHIPFQDLLSVVQQLPPNQKAKIRKVLAEEIVSVKKSNLSDLLLKGPVFTDEQIKVIEENRKSINKWRTKS